ncbi:MAG TPA: hypothetical protein ENI80_00890 [Acidiferrobacteraceae bacterium]|nr:hypothetical protein [Acidiferrobacteraceae bacterium]
MIGARDRIDADHIQRSALAAWRRDLGLRDQHWDYQAYLAFRLRRAGLKHIDAGELAEIRR